MISTDSLNPAQQQAATTTDGPLLIIAGPGSGKTHTLVERIFYLIQSKGVQPENILISTFTEKAAAELITRVSSRLVAAGIQINLNEMYIGTLHSLCLRILDENREYTRLKRNYTVMEQFDQQYQIYQTLKEYRKIDGAELIIGAPESGSWNQAEALMSWLNKASEELLSADTLLTAPDPRIQALGRLYSYYCAWMEKENVLDFSSIQVETFYLLDKHPKVLEALQAKIHYLMVDEYQDTNTVQEAILLKLAKGHQNLCVVGDDDQGLYRFRGATIRNILEFPKNFPSSICTRVELTRNYRSHPDIIRFFNEWMSELDWTDQGTTFRYPKQIEARPGEFWSGPAVLTASSTGGDALWFMEILALLRHLRDQGKLQDWNQVAFLFRSVKSDRAVGLARFLETNGIPVYAPRSNLFFEREEVMLVFGAFIFLFPQFEPTIKAKWPKDAKPPEIWDWYERCLNRFVTELRKPEQTDLLKWARFRARDHSALKEATDYAFSGLFYQLLQFPLFSRYLGDDALGGVRDSRPARNLALISKLLTRFEYFHHIPVLTPDYLESNLRRLFNNYLRFLEEGGLVEFEDNSEYAPSGCVSFMTVHQAKGLEFPVVIVDSLDAVPRKQYTEIDEVLQANFYRKPPFEPIEKTKFYDFWRLYYTAFSRAQNLLFLSAPENAGPGKKIPSEPFRSLYNTLPHWRAYSNALQNVVLASIKDVDLKRRYSFTSHITLYENCARQYKFFKDLEFVPVRSGAILFGTLVHQTIEDIHRAALRGEESKIQKLQIEAWLNNNYRQLAAKERRYLPPHTIKSALEQVQRYVEQVQRTYHSWAHIRDAEVDVSLVRDRYILEGSVDLIQGEGDSVEIIDFKSEKKPDLVLERERINRYKRQIEIYGFLVQERQHKSVSKLHIHYTGETMGNPRLSFPMDPVSVHKTIETFDKTVDQIERKAYNIAQRPVKLCTNCDMKHYCDKQ